MSEAIREKLIEASGQEPPDEALVKRVIAAIGMPPNAVTFYKLMNTLPAGENEDEVCRVLDLLYKRGDIDETNGWIHGVKRIDTSKWTKDDWDWIFGSGRFAQ
jgi:hypothetical protein